MIAVVGGALLVGCSAAEDAANKGKDAAKDAANKGADAAKDAAGKGADAAKDAAAGAAGAVADAAGNGLVDTVKTTLSSLGDAAKGLTPALDGKTVKVSGTVKDEATKKIVDEAIAKIPAVAGYTVDASGVTVGG